MRFLHLLQSLAATLRRLHPVTWVAVLCVAALLVLIVVPGQMFWPAFGRELSPWQSRCEDFRQETFDRLRLQAAERGIAEPEAVVLYEHGWPRPFLVRGMAVDSVVNGIFQRSDGTSSTPLIRIPGQDINWSGSQYYDVSWSNYDHWPVAADGYLLDYWSLALDVVVLLLIVGAIAAAVEWRARRGIFRFGLADLFAAIAVCGVLLAFCTYHIILTRIETAGTVRAFSSRGFWFDSDSLVVGERYFGPLWLSKLVGNENLLTAMRHVHVVTVFPSTDADKQIDFITRLPCLEEVSLHTRVSRGFVRRLEECPRLTRLELLYLEQAVGLASTLDEEDLFTPRHFDLLGRLHLTSIELSGRSVDAEALEKIAALPTIRRITIGYASATPAEIEAIGKKYPQVHIAVGQFL